MAKNARTAWAAKLGNVPAGATTARPATTGKPGDLLTRGRAFEGIILGIDPSLRGTGLAVVAVASGKTPRLLATKTVMLSAQYSMTQCLGRISDEVLRMTQLHPPDVAVVEETIYVQNFRTAQILGAARGAAIGPLARDLLPIFEYAPRRIKQAISGSGRASKEQMAQMVQSLFQLPEPLPFDEADAASAALCHAYTWREEG